MSLGTECAKCGAAMPRLLRGIGGKPTDRVALTITGYSCCKCNHYNNLKRRRWWKAAQKEATQ